MSRSVVEQRWLELGPLFDAAYELEGEDRALFLASVPDTELRLALARMLAEADADSPLDAGSGRLVAALIDIEPGIEGSRLGAWRVGHRVGIGGMASVFLAMRDDGAYEQQAAIKMLRYGIHEAAERERFIRERQILARLDHPHIARLLDGGFTEAGVPWFALEYVDGLPITEWCDAQKLGLDARLRLFSDVCEAVDFAHRHLVVHRDLKPSNILVREDGTLKLLDFGIAKLIEEEGADSTRTGLRFLTPAYAAPEQQDGGTITTATDVYALGVLLHEILTGSRPRWHEDATLIPPSSAVTGPQALHIASARQSQPRTLRRRIGGELDLILAKALRQNPQERYVGAAALAQDLRYHRRGIPISARPASRGYRMTRFIRRHRLGFAVAGALVITLFAGLAATLWQMGEAREEAARANATRDFVLSLFDGITPDESRGRDVTARELLDRSAGRLAETLAEQPKVETELSVALAAAYRQLGDFSRAEDLAERGITRASSAPHRAAALVELANLRRAQGRFEDAESSLRQALPLAPELHGEITLRLADVLSDRGLLDEAREMAERALDANPTDPELQAEALASLGGIHFREGELEPALAALQQALEGQRALHGEQHTRTAAVHHDLGVVLLQKGEVEAATGQFSRALEIRRALLGEAHPDTADSELNLGIALRRQGDTEAAVKHITQAVERQKALLGPGHPAVASGINSLALIALERGDPETALGHFREALDNARATFGPNHPTVATMLNNIAGLERSLGRHTDAEASARAAIESATGSLGEDHYLTAIARMGLGITLLEQGDAPGARRELDNASERLEAALGKTHPDALLARATLALALQADGEPDTAREIAGAALDAGSAAFPDNHFRLGRLRYIAARIEATSGDCDHALPLLEQADIELSAGGAMARTERAWTAALRANCLREAGAAAGSSEALALARERIEALPFVPQGLTGLLQDTDPTPENAPPDPQPE